MRNENASRENGLVECVNSLSFAVATRLVKTLKISLDPHIPCYFTLKIIDPTTSRGIHAPAT